METLCTLCNFSVNIKLLLGFPGGSVVKKRKKKIHLQCRRHRFDPWEDLPWEDPTCRRAAEPVCHDYGACALEPRGCSYWSPSALERVLHNKTVKVKTQAIQSCPTLWDPADCPWNSPGQNTGVGSLSIAPGDLPNPGIKPESLTLQADSLPAELPGKPTTSEATAMRSLWTTPKSIRSFSATREACMQ